MVFCGALLEDVEGVAFVLGCFELITGLKVNFKKLSVVVVGADPDLVSCATTLFDYKVVFPYSIFRSSLCDSRVRASDWSPTVDRFEWRLFG